MAFDLAEEFRKANLSAYDLVPVNYDTHPRQVLRQASVVFAPLGNAFVMAANQAGMRLDEYFLAVERYNAPFRQHVRRDDFSAENQEAYNTVQSFRAIVGATWTWPTVRSRRSCDGSTTTVRTTVSGLCARCLPLCARVVPGAAANRSASRPRRFFTSYGPSLHFGAWKPKRSMAKPSCFVVGPIGEEGSDIRKRSDDLLTYIIKDVLESAPFNMQVDRADEMPKPGLIPTQVIERVVNADLVVADLADLKNPNVFYELALRHAVRKPVVHLLLVGHKLPFDVSAQRTIYYQTTDLSSAAKAKADLKKHVEAVLANPESADNPISAALGVLDLLESKDAREQGLGRILQELTDLRGEVRQLQPSGTTSATPLGAALRAANLGMPATEQQRKFMESGGRWFEAFTPPPLFCANCREPIGLLDSVQRSSDGALIHRRCPPPAPPPTGTPSTSAS